MVKEKLLHRLRKKIKRLRHRKGFGVHSPFVYALVREVFMWREVSGTLDESICSKLLTLDLGQKHRVEITNLILRTPSQCVAINTQPSPDDEMVICGVKMPQDSVDQVIEGAKVSGCTVIIVGHATTTERELHYQMVVESHRSTTIDREGYLIIFNNHLPKQHFIL